MDKQQIALRFAKARDTYSQAACAQRQVADKMLGLVEEALTYTRRNTPTGVKQCLPAGGDKELSVVEIGCGTGIYSELLLHRLHPSQMLLVDLCPEMEPLIRALTTRHPEVEATFMAADAEQMDLPTGIQLITSCSTVQWFEAPQAFVKRCAQSLAPEGVLAFSTFGPDNLQEISTLTGHGLYYPTLAEWHTMMPPTLHLHHAEEERITLWFPSPIEVLKHLKETGVTGTEKQVWSKQRLHDFCQAYNARFSNARGEVSLTYHPMYLVSLLNRYTHQ